jgi:hypothetical protein
MLITSYDYAHKIVDNNKFLIWKGWDIMEAKPSAGAQYNESGKLINGIWHYTDIFPITEKGWEIPNKYARS